MMSRIGRITPQTRSLRAHQTPTGIPMSMQITIAVVISDKVVMASSHTPRAAMITRATALNSATPRLAAR